VVVDAFVVGVVVVEARKAAVVVLIRTAETPVVEPTPAVVEDGAGVLIGVDESDGDRVDAVVSVVLSEPQAADVSTSRAPMAAVASRPRPNMCTGSPLSGSEFAA
jgi:ABC-type uncharacterized transport system substrate-binding protein